MLKESGPLRGGSGYRTAASALPPAIRSAVEEQISGEPLDRAAEIAAQNSNGKLPSPNPRSQTPICVPRDTLLFSVRRSLTSCVIASWKSLVARSRIFAPARMPFRPSDSVISSIDEVNPQDSGMDRAGRGLDRRISHDRPAAHVGRSRRLLARRLYQRGARRSKTPYYYRRLGRYRWPCFTALTLCFSVTPASAARRAL